MAGQGVSVGPEPRRGQTDEDVSGLHPVHPEHGVALHDTDGEPGQVEFAGAHGSGMFGHLSPEQGTAGPATAVGHAGDERLHLVGDELPGDHVVEEEQRLRSQADQVVDAHGHEVDADGVETSGVAGHERLGPHTVGGGHENGLGETSGVEGEAAAEATDAPENFGPRRRGHVLTDALHGAVAGGDLVPEVGQVVE